MKKIFNFILVLFFTSFVFADLVPQNRKLEVGVEAEGGLSNNYFRASEMLVSDLVIDLNEISNEMSGTGLVLDFLVNAKTWFALNINEKMNLKFFFGVEGSGYGNISKNFFDALCSGLDLNTDEDFNLKLYGDIYAQAGMTFKTQIKEFGVSFTPSLFAPVFHVAESKGTVNYKSTESGLIRAEADVPVNVYSVIDLDGIKDRTIDSAYIQDALSTLVKGAGFDLAFEIDHKIGEKFTLGAFTRIPLVPGSLSYKASTRYWAVFEQSNTLGVLNETSSTTKDYGHDDITYSEADEKIHRPFILGLEGAWKPFGNWCTFYPKLNLAVRNPYSGENQVYGEFAIVSDFSLFNVATLRLGTAYENLVFKQTAGFMLNFRAVELDAAVMFRGEDFSKSFGMSGLGAYIAVKCGW